MSKNNVYWDVAFFNSTNSLASKTLEVTQNANDFVNLGRTNKELVEENAVLRNELISLREARDHSYGYEADSVKINRFDFTVAKVVGSTHSLSDNFITIDKGTEDGIRPGMGVISPQGIVGQVAFANKHYSRVYSILHSKMVVSSEIKNKKLRETEDIALGASKWDGKNFRYLIMGNVDRFKPVFEGDSVVTSKQNSIFPADILIGKITKVSNNPAEAFHQIRIKLSTDFGNLSYVYVIKNNLIDSQNEVEEKVLDTK